MPDRCELCSNNGFCKYIERVKDLEKLVDSFCNENEDILTELRPLNVVVTCEHFHYYKT